MRRFVLLLSVIALSACQAVEQVPTETTSITTATGPLPPRERVPGTVATFEYLDSSADRSAREGT